MKKVYTIGRDPQSDIVINDRTDVVSRLHATIRFEGSKMFLNDQSQNGTYINGMRMSSNEEIPVLRGDVVSFANVATLDWSLLPDVRKIQMRKYGYIASAFLLIIGVFVAVALFTNKPEKPDSNNTQPEQLVSEIPSEDANEKMGAEGKTDSINADTLKQNDSNGELGRRKKVKQKKTAKEDESNSAAEKTGNSPQEEVDDVPQTEEEIPLY